MLNLDQLRESLTASEIDHRIKQLQADIRLLKALRRVAAGNKGGGGHGGQDSSMAAAKQADREKLASLIVEYLLAAGPQSLDAIRSQLRDTAHHLTINAVVKLMCERGTIRQLKDGTYKA